MKDINVTVVFTVSVPDDTKLDDVYVEVDPKNVSIMAGPRLLTKKEIARPFEFTTSSVELVGP